MLKINVETLAIHTIAFGSCLLLAISGKVPNPVSSTIIHYSIGVIAAYTFYKVFGDEA